MIEPLVVAEAEDFEVAEGQKEVLGLVSGLLTRSFLNRNHWSMARIFFRTSMKVLEIQS